MNTLVKRFVGAWVRPFSTLAELKTEGAVESLKPSLLLVIAVSVLNGIIMAIMGSIFPPQLIATGQAAKSTLYIMSAFVPVFYIIGSFLLALGVWVIVGGALRGTGQDYKSAYQVVALTVAFSPLSTLFSPIPKVGEWVAILINLWALVVLIQGVVIVFGTPKTRTWVTFVIIFLVMFLLTFLAMINSPQAGNFGGGYSDASGFGADSEDLSLSDEELTQRMKEITEQEKAAPTTKRN